MKRLNWSNFFLPTVVFFCLAFHLLSKFRPLMNAITGISLRVRQILGRLCGVFPFSLAELLCCVGVLLVLVWLIWTLISVIRAVGSRWKTLWKRLNLLLSTAATLYLLLCLSLGASYRADSFQDRSGLYAQPSDVEDLYQTTRLFVERLCDTADSVPRNPDGVYDVELDELFAHTKALYRGVEQSFPFLAMEDTVPKRIWFSRLMSRFNYTGFYFPYTGEANINVDTEDCMIPSTIAHEMAHQRGVASEQEANFVAILACVESGDALYTYPGWLFGYIHLSNALYRYDRDRYFALVSLLPEAVHRDLNANNAYWAQFETKAAEITEKVYDTMLKSYGQSLGVQSYGAVVDLLIAWDKAGGFAE